MARKVGDKMKIYINSNYEIKAINSTDDLTLTEIEVDRELVFGNMSDFMILNYCYKPSDNGYSVYPAKDYSMLELLDNQLVNKISILEGENEKLKLEQEQQNEEILVNMLANTEMFEMLLGMIPMTLSKDKTKNNGGNSMIEVYVTLIIKGVKTIEDVPLVIREQVIERLKQLEVPVK